MLCQHCAHEQSAIAATENRELLRARPFLFDQIVGRGRKIIEHILLLRQVTGFMPFLAELTATANICHDKHAATIEPGASRKIEIGLHADAITAVAIKQGSITAIELCSFATKD